MEKLKCPECGSELRALIEVEVQAFEDGSYDPSGQVEGSDVFQVYVCANGDCTASFQSLEEIKSATG